MSVPNKLVSLGFEVVEGPAIGRKKVKWPTQYRYETICRDPGEPGLGEGGPVLDVGAGELAVVVKGAVPVGALAQGRYEAKGQPGPLGLVWVKSKNLTLRSYVDDIWTRDHRRIKGEFWIDLVPVDAACFVAEIVGDAQVVGRKSLHEALDPYAQRVLKDHIEQATSVSLETARDAFVERLSPGLETAFDKLGLSVTEVKAVSLVLLTRRTGGGSASFPAPAPEAVAAAVVAEVATQEAEPEAPPEVIEEPVVSRRSERDKLVLEEVSMSGGAEEMVAAIQVEVDTLGEHLAAGRISVEEYNEQVAYYESALQEIVGG